MLNLIIILFYFFIGFRLLLHILVKIVNFINKKNQTEDHFPHQNYPKNAISSLAKCDYCGLYTTKDDSFFYNGKFFCCKEHAYNK